MGKCSYCGGNAGVLRGRHQKCHNAHTKGLKRIVDVTVGAVLHGNPAFTELVGSIARRSHIDSDTLQQTILKGWSVAVDRCLKDGLMISLDDEERLTGFAESHLRIDGAESVPAWDRMALGVTIRNVMEGMSPSYELEFSRPPPVNFEQSEILIWVFADVELWEERVVEIPQSWRLPPSLSAPLFPVDMSDPYDRMYARVTDRLNQVRQQEYISRYSRPTYGAEPQHLETGYLIATTRNLYFLGGSHTKRMPYSTIVAVSPNEGSFGVTQEDGTFQLFANLQGPLTSALIIQLSRNGQLLEAIPNRGYMGVGIADAERNIGTRGVMLDEITVGGPADDTGLAKGDIIQQLGDSHIRSAAELARFLSQHSPGSVVHFSALREGEVVTGQLTLGRRPEG